MFFQLPFLVFLRMSNQPTANHSRPALETQRRVQELAVNMTPGRWFSRWQEAHAGADCAEAARSGPARPQSRGGARRAALGGGRAGVPPPPSRTWPRREVSVRVLLVRLLVVLEASGDERRDRQERASPRVRMSTAGGANTISSTRSPSALRRERMRRPAQSSRPPELRSCSTSPPGARLRDRGGPRGGSAIGAFGVLPRMLRLRLGRARASALDPFDGSRNHLRADLRANLEDGKCRISRGVRGQTGPIGNRGMSCALPTPFGLTRTR